MAKHTIDDLREHLFAALAGLKDGTVDIDKAKAISELSQTIINSAKVEVDYLKAVDGGGSEFLGVSERPPAGIVGTYRHRLGQ